MRQNPFQVTFGKEPEKFVARLNQTDEIIESFSMEKPSSQVYMLTGVRGSGKTVLLSHIANHFRSNKDWIVIELNPLEDLMKDLTAKLYDNPGMKKRFIKAKIDLSFLGIGISLEKTEPVSDIGTALERMLKEVDKEGKRLLITVDEAINNENVRIFAGDFQILMRQNYPIFLLMTGLYENIYDLQNEKTLTFLYRAPKIVLGPLNINAVANQYRNVFNISEQEALDMAKLTKGYPFAFQVLGYLRFKYDGEKTIEEIMPEYDQYLEEYVYEKLWSELSTKDKEIMSVLAETGRANIKDLREKLDMKSGDMSTYRKRLIRKGMVDASEYGKLSIVLPRFAEIIKMWN